MRSALQVPQGYHIERAEHESIRLRDLDDKIDRVTFAVIDEGDDDERPCTIIEAKRSPWDDGEWMVRPGSTTNRIEPKEALARAAAMEMAARECMERNDA